MAVKEGGGAGVLRAFVLSDFRPLRHSLRALLEHEGIEVAGESWSASEALQLIPGLCPDVALMDAKLPDGTAVDVYRGLREAGVRTPCIIFVSYHGQVALGRSDEDGLRVVLREISHDLLRTIREVTPHPPRHSP